MIVSMLSTISASPPTSTPHARPPFASPKPSDANYVVIGSYTVANRRISVQAQVLAINDLKMSPPIEDSNDLQRLFDVQNTIAWKIARSIDPHFNVAQQTFLAASGQIKLSAFENYIRGIGAATPPERIKRLQLATQQSPGYAAALLALGKAQYLERDYDRAAATFSQIPPTDRRLRRGELLSGACTFQLCPLRRSRKGLLLRRWPTSAARGSLIARPSLSAARDTMPPPSPKSLLRRSQGRGLSLQRCRLVVPRRRYG